MQPTVMMETPARTHADPTWTIKGAEAAVKRPDRYKDIADCGQFVPKYRSDQNKDQKVKEG